MTPRYGRWWIARRVTAVSLMALFVAGGMKLQTFLVGDYRASKVAGVLPLADPVTVASSFFATGSMGTDALVGALLVTAFYFVVGGRAFCGWVCPLGLVVDVARWAGDRLGLRRPFAGFPSHTKEALLGAILLASLLSGVALYGMYDPVGVAARQLIYHGYGVGLAGIGVVALIAVYEMAVAQSGWRRTLCPVGAFYGLLGRKSPLGLVTDAPPGSLAPGLGAVCPEPAAMHALMKEGRASGECLLCGACVDATGEGSVRYGFRTTKRRGTP